MGRGRPFSHHPPTQPPIPPSSPCAVPSPAPPIHCLRLVLATSATFLYEGASARISVDGRFGRWRTEYRPLTPSKLSETAFGFSGRYRPQPPSKPSMVKPKPGELRMAGQGAPTRHPPSRLLIRPLFQHRLQDSLRAHPQVHEQDSHDLTHLLHEHQRQPGRVFHEQEKGAWWEE